MRALRSTLLVRRVTPCGLRTRRRRRRFQSEKVENGLRHRRASARVRRFERLRRSREPCPTSEAMVSRFKKARFEVGIARAQHARIVRFRVFIGREERRALRELLERRERDSYGIASARRTRARFGGARKTRQLRRGAPAHALAAHERRDSFGGASATTPMAAHIATVLRVAAYKRTPRRHTRARLQSGGAQAPASAEH